MSKKGYSSQTCTIVISVNFGDAKIFLKGFINDNDNDATIVNHEKEK